MLTRRNMFVGLGATLLAAPAIVDAANLMKIKPRSAFIRRPIFLFMAGRNILIDGPPPTFKYQPWSIELYEQLTPRFDLRSKTIFKVLEDIHLNKAL